MTGKRIARLLRRFPGRPVFCFDFDGTLSPFVDDPSRAAIPARTRRALRRLERRADLVFLSSRPAAFLRRKTAFLFNPLVLGSHGLEFPGGKKRIPARERMRLNRARKEAEKLAAEYAGAFVEKKPAGFTLHLRKVKAGTARKRLERKAFRLLSKTGMRVTRGAMAVEASAPSSPTKAATLARLARTFEDRLVVFFGDDEADERAFRALRKLPNGLPVSVGRRSRSASAWVQGPRRVAGFLSGLLGAWPENA